MRASHALLPDGGFDVARLLAPEQAVAAFCAQVPLAPPPLEQVDLEAAFGRILAQPLLADAPYPSHPRSTMDGFAVRASSTPATLEIDGEILMGQDGGVALRPGKARRIPTGGALPEGADAVVPIEDVREHVGGVDVPTLSAGANVTQAGEDMRPGDQILEVGRRIGGPELGVLATLGATRIDVFRRPRIGIISTGDELIGPHEPLGIGKVRDSNRYAIAGALQAMGAQPLHFPRAPDTLEALQAILAATIEQCDAVLLTGGSSVGERDHAPAAIAALGNPGVLVHGLRVKPGKPTVLGAVGARPVIGLPGNPSSALMILEAVVRPIITALTGASPHAPAGQVAIAQEAFVGRDGWTWFIPAVVHLEGTKALARPLRLRSAHTSLLARASGFVVIDEMRGRIEAGEPVLVRTLSAGGLA